MIASRDKRIWYVLVASTIFVVCEMHSTTESHGKGSKAADAIEINHNTTTGKKLIYVKLELNGTQHSKVQRTELI
jgi:hypothetical protein